MTAAPQRRITHSPAHRQPGAGSQLEDAGREKEALPVTLARWNKEDQLVNGKEVWGKDSPDHAAVASGASREKDPKQPDREEPLASPVPLTRRVPAWKRPLDIALALTVGILALPLIALIALAIKASSRGPVLYRQRRVGLGLRTFEMLKFRTMYRTASEATHRDYVLTLQAQGRPLQKLDAGRDDRVTPVGRVLRVLGLDELPQLCNILRGDMSVVGPRPCIPYELATYRPWHYYRFECLPGVTGLWQVNGKTQLSFNEMVTWDIRYARRQSPGLDLLILARTPWAVGEDLWQRWRERRRAARLARVATVSTPS